MNATYVKSHAKPLLNKDAKSKDALEKAEALFVKPEIPTETVKISKGALHQISKSTYVAALTNSLVSNKYALQLEMATCLAVFMETGNVGRDAKQVLMGVYADAGYDCLHHTGADYKTVSRRINVSALLFTHIGRVSIENMCDGAVEMMVINSIVGGLEPLNLKTIDGILSFVGKPTREKSQIVDQNEPTQPENSQSELANNESAPDTATVVSQRIANDELDLTESSEEDIVRLEKWLSTHSETPLRHQWELNNGFRHIDIGMLHVSIPPNTSKDDIIRAAMAMLAMAEKMTSEAPNVGEIKNLPQFINDKVERLSENSEPPDQHKRKKTTKT